MKFLLTALNAKYIHSNPALYSLRAYVGEELQEYVELAEYTINHDFAAILADIYKRKPEVIGFSCYIWNIDMVLKLVKELPKLLPETDIWLGGPEVSFDAPKLLIEYPMLKGIMVGEGEQTFQELLTYYVNRQKSVKTLQKKMQLENRNANEEKLVVSAVKLLDSSKQELEKIAGLCLSTGYTAPRELTDMNQLPFLYEDIEQFQNRIIYYESSRGCPFCCSYCLSSIDKKVRLRDIAIVKKELQFFLDNQVKQVKFVDRTFNCNHEHAMAIWHYITEHDNSVTNFHFEISADILIEEEIALLNKMRPGLVQLEIGVQSTNPQTLQAIHRHMDVEKLEKIVAAIRKGNNVHQHLDLIAGLPYEDYEGFGKSFDRVYAMRPQQLQLGFLKVLKGSEMCERVSEYGITYMERPPYEVLFTNWLSFEDVLKLKRIEEMVELYYNSNQFTYSLQLLEQAFTSPFAMYEALAQFYEEKGYFVNSPARSYRYQVLLAFALEQDGTREAIYREALTYDMYLRENLKSRPEFACDLQAYKELRREFYQKEASEFQYLPDYREYDSKQLARMTHLEPFHYPVWETTKEEYKRLEKPVFILFDYKKRNPLNEEARTIPLSL